MTNAANDAPYPRTYRSFSGLYLGGAILSPVVLLLVLLLLLALAIASHGHMDIYGYEVTSVGSVILSICAVWGMFVIGAIRSHFVRLVLERDAIVMKGVLASARLERGEIAGYEGNLEMRLFHPNHDPISLIPFDRSRPPIRFYMKHLDCKPKMRAWLSADGLAAVAALGLRRLSVVPRQDSGRDMNLSCPIFYVDDACHDWIASLPDLNRQKWHQKE